MVGPNRPTTGCMCGCTAEIAALKVENEKLRGRLVKANGLLNHARCPDTECNGKGIPEHTQWCDQNEGCAAGCPELRQCQWCTERTAALRREGGDGE